VIRRYGGAVLVFEALVIILAIPVAINVGGARAPAAVGGGLLLAAAAVVVAARLDRPWAVAAGWIVQAWVLLSAFVVPVMGILGLLFTGLWYAALRLARADDAVRGSAGRAGPTPAGENPTEET
jgi:hypothetical protein